MSEMGDYKPEPGQIAFGSWLPNLIPEYAEALIFQILKEMKRVANNVKPVKPQEPYWDYQEYAYPIKLGSVEFSPYYWGEGKKEQMKPNLIFGEVTISWYKRPGRGLSTNVDFTPTEWIDWFDRCLKNLRQYEFDIIGDLGYTNEYLKYLERERL